MAADALRVLPAEAEERLLDDIARRVQTAEEPGRVADQRRSYSVRASTTQSDVGGRIMCFLTG
jgi:hypothetical protein